VANLAKYIVQLEAQTARYQAELEKANKTLGRFHKQQTAAINAVKNGVLALAAAFSVRMLVRYTKDTLDAAEALKNLADRTGNTVEALSELQHVAKLSDVDFEQLAKSMQFMSRALGEAELGSKSARQAFANLGIDFKAISNLPTAEQLAVIADSLAQVENESVRTALALKVFGRGGAEILQVTNGGAAAIRRLVKEAHDLGLVLSTESAIAAGKATDEIDRLTASASALGRAFVVQVAPAIGDFAEWLRKLAFPTPEEMGVTGTTGALKKIKDEILELETSLAGMRRERAGVDFLERLVGMDEAEWDRRIAEIEDDLSHLYTSARQMQDSLPKPSGADGLEALQKQANEAQVAFNAYSDKLAGIKLVEPAQLAQLEALRRTAVDAHVAVMELQFKIAATPPVVEPPKPKPDTRELDEITVPNMDAMLAMPDWQKAMADAQDLAVANWEAGAQRRVEAEREMFAEIAEMNLNVRSEEGRTITEGLEQRLAERIAIEEEITAAVSDAERVRAETAKRTADYNIEIARNAANQEIALRQLVTDSAMGLLSALGAEHRGAAIALLVWQKAIAIKEILINAAKAKTMVAAYYEVAIAQALSMGPLGLPWVAVLEAKRAAALGKIAMGTALSVGLVAAEGVVEAAQLSSGGTQATRGTSANPVNVTSGAASTASQTTAQGGKRVTQVVFQGDMYGFDDYVRNRIIASIREAVDGSDVVIVGQGSRQARMLGGV
jgi:hypothetical protein